jgi:hypothetical protein
MACHSLNLRHVSLYGSLYWHHRCLEQPTRRFMENSASCASSCALVHLELFNWHCARDMCCNHLVEDCHAQYNVGKSALHLEPRSSTEPNPCLALQCCRAKSCSIGIVPCCSTDCQQSLVAAIKSDYDPECYSSRQHDSGHDSTAA